MTTRLALARACLVLVLQIGFVVLAYQVVWYVYHPVFAWSFYMWGAVAAHGAWLVMYAGIINHIAQRNRDRLSTEIRRTFDATTAASQAREALDHVRATAAEYREMLDALQECETLEAVSPRMRNVCTRLGRPIQGHWSPRRARLELLAWYKHPHNPQRRAS